MLPPNCSYFFLPPFFHFRALRAKFARLRVLGFLDRFILRSFDTGIFLPFLVPVDLRSLPRLDFLILIPDRFLRRATMSLLNSHQLEHV